MSAIAITPERASEQLAALDTTLLDLVHELSRAIQDEEELVATVLHRIHTGQVRLTGNFRSVLISQH